MTNISAYLAFDGNCREAMTFYADALGAELNIMPFTEMPNCPAGSEDRVIHARVHKGEVSFFASDTMPGQPAVSRGNDFMVCIGCESQAEEEKLFAAMSEGGKVTMPLQDTFWNAHFGMLTDKFGVRWMFNFEKSKE